MLLSGRGVRARGRRCGRGGREGIEARLDRIAWDRIAWISDSVGSDRVGSDRVGSDRVGSDRVRLTVRVVYDMHSMKPTPRCDPTASTAPS